MTPPELRRRHDFDDLELYEVGPGFKPGLKRGYVRGTHELESASAFWSHPTLDELDTQALGDETPVGAEPGSDLLWSAKSERLDDHHEHSLRTNEPRLKTQGARAPAHADW